MVRMPEVKGGGVAFIQRLQWQEPRSSYRCVSRWTNRTGGLKVGQVLCRQEGEDKGDVQRFKECNGFTGFPGSRTTEHSELSTELSTTEHY